MDPRMIPKGGSNEYNYGEQDGMRRPNEPGVYYHPSAGKFIETAGVERPDGSIAYNRDGGKIQGDAFVQIGYRKATDEELAEYRAKKAESAETQRRKSSSRTTVLSTPKS